MCLFNFGLFSVHLPLIPTDEVCIQQLGKLKLVSSQDEESKFASDEDFCLPSKAHWRILLKTTINQYISSFYLYDDYHAVIISSGKLKLISLDPPSVLTTFNMPKDGGFDSSFHKCGPLDGANPLLKRFILGCNPFKIVLIDTRTHEVFTLSRVVVSNNFMNE